VTLRLAQPAELLAARAALDAGHYLGAPKPAECDLVDSLPRGTLDGKIVGGDALHADDEPVRQLVQRQGAVTFMQLKNNQPTAARRDLFQSLNPEISHSRVWNFRPVGPTASGLTATKSLRPGGGRILR